jgi:DNA-directed RNA polymerase subunit RPC12/RpoP
MPVKVRCSTCEKVLNAPDAARGKAIKCPGCQGKISVPPEGASASATAKKAKPKKPVDEDEDFLSNLDLEKSVDANSPVCPKCGADVDAEDIECPACGVNVQTGQLSAKRQKKAALKGADPDDYYKVAIPDSWAFMLRHTGYAAQSSVIALLLFAFIGGLGFVVGLIPVDKWPPRMFLTAFMMATYLAIPGWYWRLFLATVKLTMGKKDQIKDVKFDLVTAMADGIQFTLWSNVYFLPTLAASVVLILFVVPAVQPGELLSLLTILGAFYGPQVLAGLFAAPAFAHLASYSQWRGWLLPVMLTKVLKVPGQSAMFAVTAIIGSMMSMLFVLLAIVLWALVFASALLPFLFAVIGAKEAGAPQEVAISALAVFYIAMLILLFFMVLFASALGMLFTARSAGLFAFYCKDHLGLLAKPAEQKWVSKARKVDEDGNVVTPPWVTVLGIMGVSLLFAVAAYIIMRQMG